MDQCMRHIRTVLISCIPPRYVFRPDVGYIKNAGLSGALRKHQFRAGTCCSSPPYSRGVQRREVRREHHHHRYQSSSPHHTHSPKVVWDFTLCRATGFCLVDCWNYGSIAKLGEILWISTSSLLIDQKTFWWRFHEKHLHWRKSLVSKGTILITGRTLLRVAKEVHCSCKKMIGHRDVK